MAVPTWPSDSCFVRGKRGGHLTDPTDRARRGTKYHIVMDGHDASAACVTTGVNINDTLVFEHLFLFIWAVMARIHRVFAGKAATQSIAAILRPLWR